jgi:hypothetical protein
MKMNDIQNANLYEALSALTRISLEILIKSFEKYLVVTTESTWMKQDNDTYVRQDIKHPLWAIILHKAKNEISKTKEFNIVSEVVKSDKIISSQLNTLVGTCMGRIRLGLDNIVFKPITRFLTDTEIIGYDDSIFRAEYLRIEDSLYSDEIEFERLTPLCGFYMDNSDILLNNNISIIRLSEYEIIDLLRHGIKVGDSFGPENFIHHIHQFAIKLKYSLPKIVGDHDIEGSIGVHNPYITGDMEQAVINALRIFKEGKVYPLGAVTKNYNLFNFGVSYNYGNPSKYFMIDKFKLVENEKDNFLEFWETYNMLTIPEKHYLSVAIRRFSQASERESIEDKIFDFFISAEALFLSSGGSSQGELKYRLSHRAAMFIEDEPEKQRNVFEYMQRAYDVRSAIVHGTTPKLLKKEDGTSCSLEEFCKDMESHLRFSLKKAIKLAALAEGSNKIIEWNSIIFPKSN